MLRMHVKHVYIKHPGKHNSGSPVIPVPAALKLVKDAVVLIEGAQLTPEIFMHLMGQSGSIQSTALQWPLINYFVKHSPTLYGANGRIERHGDVQKE